MRAGGMEDTSSRGKRQRRGGKNKRGGKGTPQPTPVIQESQVSPT